MGNNRVNRKKPALCVVLYFVCARECCKHFSRERGKFIQIFVSSIYLSIFHLFFPYTSAYLSLLSVYPSIYLSTSIYLPILFSNFYYLFLDPSPYTLLSLSHSLTVSLRLYLDDERRYLDGQYLYN